MTAFVVAWAIVTTAALVWALSRLRSANGRSESADQTIKRFATASQAAGIGVWELDLETKELSWNSTMFELYGVPRDVAPSYQVWADHVHPDDLSKAEAQLHEAVDGNSPLDIEFRVRRGQDPRDCRHLTAVAIVEQDRQGKPYRVTGVNTDVTKRYQAEVALTRAHSLLEEAGRLARVGAWELDVISNRMTWSDQVRRIHEVDDDYAPTIETAVAFYAPHHRPVIERCLENAMLTRSSWDTELQLDTAQGRRIWVRVLGHAEHRDGECVRLLGTFQEINEQREQADALRRSEERLALAIDGTNDGLWDWDILHDTGWVSNRYRQLLLYSADAPIETAPHTELERIHPDDRERVTRMLAATLSRGSRFDLEYRIRTTDREYRWFRVRGRTTLDTHGRAIRMAGSLTDIQHHKDAEFELIRERDRAARANRTKSDFLANMSHEIRTPMTAVLGYVDLLASEELNDQERAHHLVTIRRNGNHLLQLINDILDLSKIEAGKLPIERHNVSTASVVHEVLGLLSAQALEKRIDLAAEVQGQIPAHIWSDPNRLRQILVNLVGNGIKFTETGGVRIIIRGQRENHPEQPVARILFDIVDTGIGIPPDQIERVFEEFEQADTSISRRFGGTGLGLRITRSLVELLNGSITVDSEVGRGSRFSLDFPIGRASDEADWITSLDQTARVHSRTTPGNPTDKDKLAGLKILVAEDGLDNQKLIRHYLTRTGASVHIVDNGKKALDLWTTSEASAADYDLILMDLQMPEMDGLTATRHLRALGVDIPIIALTANTMAGDRERCIEAGFDDFQPKPIDRKRLIEACRNRTRRG